MLTKNPNIVNNIYIFLNRDVVVHSQKEKEEAQKQLLATENRYKAINSKYSELKV